MKIKERAIKELETLSPSEVAAIYEMIISLKGRPPRPRLRQQVVEGHLKVRKALSRCKGSLSEDIRVLREDRV